MSPDQNNPHPPPPSFTARRKKLFLSCFFASTPFTNPLSPLACSWTYKSADAPKYYTGHTINLSGQIAVVCLSIFGILYCMYENKARAAGKRDHRLEGLTAGEQHELGSRHPEFRYWT